MSKFLLSTFPLRFLTLLLLLLSNDIESNPGPTFYRGGNGNATLTINMPGFHPYPYISISALRPGGNVSTLAVSTPGLVYTDNTGHASNTTMPFSPINPFTDTLIVTVASNMHWTVTVVSSNFQPTSPIEAKLTNVSTEPIPVSLINPSVLPVQIDNIDPIEVSFSVENPLPVSIINPSILPVQIESPDPISVTFPVTNPIPITGTVSIANPIPSVATTLLNAFKK